MQSRMLHLGLAGALLLGIALTGFSNAHWLLYLPAGWLAYAALAGWPGIARGPAKASPPAATPAPPYYAVIFTSLRSEGDHGYAETARRMVELARGQPGFLGMESAREGLGITVSYWDSLEAIRAWKANADHRLAQARGREWYTAYRVRVCRVERDYGIGAAP